ncbi:phage protease [Komagataeibacter oboediens]|uniref:Mu-like prophage I protein n=1 Tax=Komagataeibacter oboediens TaxID=65958 RepID=A0ABS5SQW1_9PROT|nr:phage protease [Komagataeibacter oboediens]MBL7232059.1 hypothetical protein [Komagataeibacter oboediens]MBT0676603.1 hypothetical protein [Komagataeibacter oboediens]MBT0679960.1 hypothetical protein [Komagataeibacter oboediens]
MSETIHLFTALPPATDGKAPEWIHLVPSGTFKCRDGRGPYRLANPQDVITHSMQDGRIHLPLDENHSTDRAATTGGSAPAIGWIDQLQARPDGIWGRVDWNQSGKTLMADRAYSGVSPAIGTTPDGVVTRIARASLTNLPNLTLTSLHNQETGMKLEDIARALGLSATATMDEVMAALKRARGFISTHTALAELARADSDAPAEQIVSGLRVRMLSEDAHTQRIKTLETENADLRQKAADAFISAAAAKKVISAELKPELVTLHMQNPKAADLWIKSLPDVPGANAPADTLHLHTQKPPTSDDQQDAETASVMADFGLTAEDAKKYGGKHGA